jgi:subtilisin family serine protease
MFTRKYFTYTVLSIVFLFTSVLNAFAVYDPVVTASSIPNDSLYSTYQANVFSAMSIPDAWDYSTGDDSIIVAVVDSGVDFSHPDLAGKLLSTGYDFVNDDNDPSDDYGHGTVVAGIIAANANNGAGIAGASNGKILPIKVLNAQGKGFASDIAEGIKYAADNGADIINLSCGTAFYSKAVEDAVNYAYDAGIVVIASTGNTGSAIEYPAACKNAIAVGAVTASKEYASYSCYGSAIDLVAVGSGVASTTNKQGRSTYVTATGTSFSAPFVSALAVLSLSIDKSLTPDEVKAAMEKGATDLGESGWDEYTGYGCINFSSTLTAILENVQNNDPSISQISMSTK